MENMKVLLEAHKDYSYVPRTCDNALGADVTVAFAVDFGTAGERLTKRQAGFRYIGIPFGSAVDAAADALSTFLEERGAKTLNVAGNGIYTLAEHGVTQAKANKWVHAVLAKVVSRVSLALIRSGGQTGIDQAGLVAAIALKVPAYGLYPKSFRRRNEKGEEVHGTAAQLLVELNTQAKELGGGWAYHVDGTLPGEDEDSIFVFGSNVAGRHGKGAALVAKERFGAVPGIGRGRMGRSYGIPTKENGARDPATGKPSLVTRSLADIARDVSDFVEYARHNSADTFFITRIGCQLAGYSDREIAPLFAEAPANCNFPEDWKPFLEADEAVVSVAPAINIWSGAPGLGGALTNMSERAREKGCIKHPYPVKINGATYPDSEAAYQALKVPGEDAYNDGLMIDIIALKFKQNAILFERVTRNGGVAWLEKCSHFTQAKSERFQAWEGQGNGSRFIRNLIQGYLKAKNGVGPSTRVVHVKEAPYDVYIGRYMGQEYPESEWQNIIKVDSQTSREAAVEQFHEHVKSNQALMSKVRLLKGRTLGCWCKSRENVHLLCHGDVLAALAEEREWVAPQAAQCSLF